MRLVAGVPLVPVEDVDVRRRSVHLVFGAVALVCAAATLVQGERLHRVSQVNRAIASADQGMGVGKTRIGDELAGAPQVVLANAVALSRQGDHDAAIRAYNSLISRGAVDDFGRAALFDLGNLYLRRGMGRGNGDDQTLLPMIELAKERYRDVLRMDPADWDARYNLERALRLAPEEEETFADDELNVPVDRRTVRLPGFTVEDLP